MEKGFQGKEGQQIPEMTDDFVNTVSERYIELYENITGDTFIKSDVSQVLKRVEENVTAFLKKDKLIQAENNDLRK